MRLQRRYALAVKNAWQSAPVDISNDYGDDAELHGEDLASAERAAAARQGAPGRLNAAIDDLLTRMNVPRQLSPLPRCHLLQVYREQVKLNESLHHLVVQLGKTKLNLIGTSRTNRPPPSPIRVETGS